MKHRGKVISASNWHLFEEEKEMDSFMTKYLTKAVNVVHAETLVNMLKEYQVKMKKQVQLLHKEKRKEKLLDHVKQNRVCNNYCQITDLWPINFCVAITNYRYLDVRLPSSKRFSTFTIAYTEERLIVLEISAKKKEIVGTYSVQMGSSDQNIVKVNQPYLKHDIMVLTNKNKLIRLKIDSLGSLSHHATFKLENRRENTQVTALCLIDDFIFIGLDDGWVQVYYLSA